MRMRKIDIWSGNLRLRLSAERLLQDARVVLSRKRGAIFRGCSVLRPIAIAHCENYADEGTFFAQAEEDEYSNGLTEHLPLKKKG